LPHDWQPTNARDDREQLNKAREAADALFTPKKQIERAEEPTSALVAPSQVEQPTPRTPRIIAMPAAMPVTDEIVAPSTDSKPGRRRTVSRRPAKVPASQHDRIRTLVTYGMTVAEVADLYGVPVDIIDRIVGARAYDHS
jgi:hypothetical protein